MHYSSQEFSMRNEVGSTGIKEKEPSLGLQHAFMVDLIADMQNNSNIVEQVEDMMNQASPDAFDVLVIGGGPGGYVAAIRAAQLGGKVALVEKGELGGVCLNNGCIPTKAMLASADAYDMAANRIADFGVNVGSASLDYGKVIERRQKIVKQLVSGVGFLMKSNKIRVFKGTASLASRTSVAITMADGKQETVSAKNIIIATGSEPVKVTIPGLEGDNVWNSDGALGATAIPKSLLIIGGGVIGVEWGYMFRKFGCNVTIIEMLPQIIPNNDAEITSELRKLLEKDGIKILTESKVTKVEHTNGSESITVVTGDKEQKFTAEKILVSVGRRSVSEGLNLEAVGVATDRGKILANDRMQTNVPSIYAIGDVVGGMLLAHKASEEGVIAAENCIGKTSKMKYNAIPACIYTNPEVATVGISEENAKEQGIDYKVGKFLFRANGKALSIGENHGFVKIIADAKYGEILGCHMIGPHVTDLIHEIVIAINAEATVETIMKSIHAHPTLSEVIHEAALDVYGESIHK